MDITTAISDAVSLDLITHVVRSDIGMRREENQDSFTIIEGEGFKFFVVADGMGGVKGGAEASQLAAVVLAQCLKSKNSITDEDIVSAVNRVNTAIFERGIEKPEYAGMGTTLVGLCFLGSNFYVVNVGDSRAYRIREGGITQLTEDHTLVTELLRSGAIDESQVENHPVSHMLTRSLGPTPIVDVDCRLETSAAQHGDFYLLCSDGLYNLVSCSEILQIVSRNTPQKAVDALVVLANERGGTDNITVILVSVGTTAGRSEDGEDADAEDHSSTSTLELNDTLELCQERDFNIPLGYGSNRESGFATGNSEASACTGVRSDSPEIRANVDAEGLASEILNQEAAKRAAAATSAASQAEPEPTEIAEEAPKSLLLQGWGVVVLVLTFSALGFMIGGYFSGREGGFDPGPGVVPPALEVALSSNHAENRVEITKKEGAKKEGALNLQEGVRLEAGADVSEISPKKISPERVETKQSPVFEDPETEVPASVDSEPQFSRLIDVDSEAGKMLPEKTEEEELDPEPLEDKVDPMDSYVQGLDDSEIANIEKRKLMLSKEISVLNDQIQSFTMPISGATNQLLRQTTEEMEELVKSRDKVKSELDIASRKLGVWYGRRERLRTTDSLKLATEVAAVSEAVRQKQEAFQQVTWQYLKEAEVLSYDPANLEQKKKVSDLMRQRKERMSELSNEVQQVISDEVGRADRILAELTIKLSALETQLDDKRKDLEYAQALFSPDSNLKDRKKQELQIRREALVTELEELRQLQPD